MRIFLAGPLTALKDPEKTKQFYQKLAQAARESGVSYFWAFLSGTDPIANPDVLPKDVYKQDIEELARSDVMLAYVGEPSTGTGIEIEYAYQHQIPVYLLYEKGKTISRLLRGSPAVTGELVFVDETDAIGQFQKLLAQLKK